jgi:pimeloyl-ACP methyl ester carboxylesterase
MGFHVKKSTSDKLEPVPLFVFHHGGGHSGDTFCLLGRELQNRIPCEILTFDCRGHGATTTDDDDNLSLERLCADLRTIIEENRGNAKEIILLGHSMGGAVVVELMSKNPIPGVIGTAVLDVVEGTAMDSLIHMRSFIASRPTEFVSIAEAVEWAIHSKQIRNRESAEISIPSQLRRVGDSFTWRTDLRRSAPYWSEWFMGMSEKFLKMRGARLLILAGTDRLDKPLTIGQMQGKFQMEILPESGHCIQEDVPDKLADILVAFYKRNQPLDISKIRKPITLRQ